MTKDEDVKAFSQALLCGSFSVNPHYEPVSIEKIIMNIDGVCKVQISDHSLGVIKFKIIGFKVNKEEIATIIYENLYYGIATCGNTIIDINYNGAIASVAFDYEEINE